MLSLSFLLCRMHVIVVFLLQLIEFGNLLRVLKLKILYLLAGLGSSRALDAFYLLGAFLQLFL